MSWLILRLLLHWYHWLLGIRKVLILMHVVLIWLRSRRNWTPMIMMPWTCSLRWCRKTCLTHRIYRCERGWCSALRGWELRLTVVELAILLVATGLLHLWIIALVTNIHSSSLISHLRLRRMRHYHLWMDTSWDITSIMRITLTFILVCYGATCHVKTTMLTLHRTTAA